MVCWFFFCLWVWFFFQSANPAAKLVSVWLVGSIEGLAVSVGHLSLAQSNLPLDLISENLTLIPFLGFVSLKFWLPVECSGMARWYPLGALCDAHKHLGCSQSLKTWPGGNKRLSNLAHFMYYVACIQSF